MATSRDIPADPLVVTLPGVIDLDRLDALRGTLADALGRGPVLLIADGVERVATNALLLLLSAGETARRAGHELIVHAPSASMAAAIERLGLGGAFATLTKG